MCFIFHSLAIKHGDQQDSYLSLPSIFCSMMEKTQQQQEMKFAKLMARLQSLQSAFLQLITGSLILEKVNLC